MKIISEHILALEKKIDDIQNELDKHVRAQGFEEAASLRDVEKRVREELENERKEWEEYLRKLGISETSRFCMRINNGMLEILIEHSNGSFILADGTQKTVSELFTFTNSRWVSILSELEKLINKENLKEQELQDFFESHPELILDDKYEFPIPQAIIVTEDSIEWRADFVLVPKDQITFTKILELKLPIENISNQDVNGHRKFSAKLFAAINQLKDYREAFNSAKTKLLFKEKYKTELYKPDLQLIFGRRNAIKDSKAFLELQRRENIEIKDWDTLLEGFKRKYK